MDVWFFRDAHIFCVEVTTKGGVKRYLKPGSSGLAGLAEDLGKKALHSLLMIGAGCANREPASSIVKQLHDDPASLAVKLVFILGLPADRLEALDTLKAMMVRNLRVPLELFCLDERDVALATPDLARRAGLPLMG